MNLQYLRYVCAALLLIWPALSLPAMAQDSSDSTDDDADQQVQLAPLKNAVIEANAVQIVLNDEHRQGVDWEAIVSDFHQLQLKQRDNPLWVDKKYRISVGTISNEDYAVLLDALDTVGKMTQTAQPNLTLTPDEPQSLNVALSQSGTPPVRVDVALVNAKNGPQLHVEPFVDVTLKDNTGKAVPVTLKGATEITLKENETIVLGGITSEQEITKMHKFPLLGNLPLVGLVFRSQGKWMQKTETIVFLTPRFKAQPQKDADTQ